MPPKKKTVTKKSPAAEIKAENKKTVADKEKERESFIEKLRKSDLIGDITKKIDFISTGSWAINHLIGDGTLNNKPGGIPRGYLAELYGDEGTGKTTLALHVTKQALALNQYVIYADFEKSLRTQFTYIQNMGIDVKSKYFVHLVPDTLEDGVKSIGECLVKLRPSLIVIDSVSAMMPKAYVDMDAGEDVQMGIHAKKYGTFLNWITKKLEKYNCALLTISQLRSNIKKSQYETGPSEKTSGGNAPRFFSTLRIRLKKSSKNKEEVKIKSDVTGIDESKVVSHEVKVVIEKNKLDMPFKSGPIYIEFGYGIDNIMSLILLGVNKKVIKKSGAWFSWENPNNKDMSFNIQGVSSVKKHLVNNPDVLEALKPFLRPTQDEKEMFELKEELESKGINKLNEDELDQLKELRNALGESTEDLEFTEEQLEDLKGLEMITGEK